jgi:hypothetical protein
MDFNFLGFVNRLLNMCRQTVITTFTGLAADSDAYKCMICVNDTIQDLSNLLRIRGRLTTFTFPTVANQRVYCLPKNIEYPIYDLVQQSDDLKLEQFDTNYYDNLLPDPNDWKGNPTAYYLEGFFGVQTQIVSTGDNVLVQSYDVNGILNPADVYKNVFIQGYDVSGNYIEELVTLNALGEESTIQTFAKITNINKDATNGTIKVYESITLNQLLALAPTEKNFMFAHIGLHPIPNSVITIYGRGYAKIPSLTGEYSIPLGLTERHINAIILGAYARYMRYDAKYPQESITATFQSYYDEVKKIIAMDNVNPDLNQRMKRMSEKTSLYRFRPLDRESL